MAHDHVRRCNQNPQKGGLFNDEVAFNKHHSARRRQEVRSYLFGDASDVREEDRSAVLEAISKDLEGLGIDSSTILSSFQSGSGSVDEVFGGFAGYGMPMLRDNEEGLIDHFEGLVWGPREEN